MGLFTEKTDKAEIAKKRKARKKRKENKKPAQKSSFLNYQKLQRETRKAVRGQKKEMRLRLLQDMAKDPDYQFYFKNTPSKEQAARLVNVMNRLEEDFACNREEIAIVTGLSPDWFRSKKNMELLKESAKDDAQYALITKQVWGALNHHVNKLRNAENSSHALNALSPLIKSLILEGKDDATALERPDELKDKSDEEIAFFIQKGRFPDPLTPDELKKWLLTDGGQTQVTQELENRGI